MVNNNLLPSEKPKGVWSKIRFAFYSIFNKSSKEKHLFEETNKKISDTSSNFNFLESLKNETESENLGKEETLEYIVDSVEKDPQVLDKLPIEQLEDINKYYDEKLLSVKREISKLS